jgi:hypothetical protein
MNYKVIVLYKFVLITQLRNHLGISKNSLDCNFFKLSALLHNYYIKFIFLV